MPGIVILVHVRPSFVVFKWQNVTSWTFGCFVEVAHDYGILAHPNIEDTSSSMNDSYKVFQVFVALIVHQVVVQVKFVLFGMLFSSFKSSIEPAMTP